MDQARNKRRAQTLVVEHGEPEASSSAGERHQLLLQSHGQIVDYEHKANPFMAVAVDLKYQLSSERLGNGNYRHWSGPRRSTSAEVLAAR